MQHELTRLKERLHGRRLSNIVVLTGAGISAESGVPTFRGPGGLWENHRPEDLATPEAFRRDPNLVWRWYAWRQGIVHDAKPNAAHEALARFEAGLTRGTYYLITQNVDNLHQKAGNRNVIEFHGNMLHAKCMKCGKRYGYKQVLMELEERFPPRCACGGILKPDAVFFGEAIPTDALEKSFTEAEDCDLMLVIGTSAQVEPAASLPLIAKGMNPQLRGPRIIPIPKDQCYVIEINWEPTPLTGRVSDFLIQGTAGEVLFLIEQTIKEKKGAA